MSHNLNTFERGSVGVLARVCVCVCLCWVCERGSKREREMGEWTRCTQAQFSWAASNCRSLLAAMYFGDASNHVPRYSLSFTLTWSNPTPQHILPLIPLQCPLRPFLSHYPLTSPLSFLSSCPLSSKLNQSFHGFRQPLYGFSHLQETRTVSSFSLSSSFGPSYLSLVLWKLNGVEGLVMWGECSLLC